MTILGTIFEAGTLIVLLVLLVLTSAFGGWMIGRFAQAPEHLWNQFNMLATQKGFWRRMIRWAMTDYKIYNKRIGKSENKETA